MEDLIYDRKWELLVSDLLTLLPDLGEFLKNRVTKSGHSLGGAGVLRQLRRQNGRTFLHAEKTAQGNFRHGIAQVLSGVFPQYD